MFAPLYLSNYCVNGCTYCPYHLNEQAYRKKGNLTQEEVRQEVIALRISVTNVWRWRPGKIL